MESKSAVLLGVLLVGTLIVGFISSGYAYVNVPVLQPRISELKVELTKSQSKLSNAEKELSTALSELKSHEELLVREQQLNLIFEQKVDRSIGDRLITTEGVYSELPKTLREAESQGYKLIDTITDKGITAECFQHKNALHYGKVNPKETEGVVWHGAPILLIYSSSTKGDLLGIVLESTSPQLSPPWEFHKEGHHGMEFTHWSLHLWFTEPPVNVSLQKH